VAVAAALTALAVFVTRDAWADIGRIAWRDEEQSQVFLVPLVAAWLYWVRRRRLRTYVPSGLWAGPAMVAAGWWLLRTGDRALVQSMWHLGAVVVAAGAFVTVAGGGFVARLAPVFASLCMLVPVPLRVREAVAIPLEAVAARATKAVLDTFGATVERWGNTLRIDGHDVTIAEACNGLRMAFALMLVTFAFAYGTPLRGWVRAVVVVSSPLVAVAFNVARLVPTVWAAGRFTDGVATGLHDVLGWLMLPAAFLTLLGLLRLLRWAQTPVSPYALASGS
jgi:exosortase